MNGSSRLAADEFVFVKSGETSNDSYSLSVNQEIYLIISPTSNTNSFNFKYSITGVTIDQTKLVDYLTANEKGYLYIAGGVAAVAVLFLIFCLVRYYGKQKLLKQSATVDPSADLNVKDREAIDKKLDEIQKGLEKMYEDDDDIVDPKKDETDEKNNSRTPMIGNTADKEDDEGDMIELFFPSDKDQIVQGKAVGGGRKILKPGEDYNQEGDKIVQ